MKSSGYQDREAIEAVVRRARQARDLAMGRAMVELSEVLSRWCRSLLDGTRHPRDVVLDEE